MSNYPPGVTESMIPGNTPEDEALNAYYAQKEYDPTKLAEAMYVAIEAAANNGKGFEQFANRDALKKGIAKLVDELYDEAPIDLAADMGDCGIRPLEEWLYPEPDPDAAHDRHNDGV